MKPLSANTVKVFHAISYRTDDTLICKICEHLLNSTNDIENAMNILIEDCAIYKPFESADLGELMVALSKDITNKIIYKRPKR